ncbi:MAG TPA: hypothetical protein VGP72_03855 [Planctomycetota bacterium]
MAKTEAAASTRARAAQVLELLIMGLNRREILKWATTKADPPWTCSPRQMDRYLAAANKRLEAAALPIAKRELSLALQRLNMLFARCMQVTDYKGALAVERARIELLKLSPDAATSTTLAPITSAEDFRKAESALLPVMAQALQQTLASRNPAAVAKLVDMLCRHLRIGDEIRPEETGPIRITFDATGLQQKYAAEVDEESAAESNSA